MIKFFKTSNKTNPKGKNGQVKKFVITERHLLIREAMALHKKQTKLLDGLDEETRNRLRYVAEKNVFKIPEDG